MYIKLIFKNAKRSARDYLVYIVTLTICATLFYSFLSVSSRYYKPDIGSDYKFTLLGDSMKLAICTVTLILLFLIWFVNNYMLRCRQKEFAVQAILGMEAKTIGRLFFAETFVMGICAVGLGIVLGVVSSQFVTAMLLTAYGKSYQPTWTFFPDTVLLTLFFFVLIFLVAGLFHMRTIQKTKVIDMLLADRENEPDLRKSHWIHVVVILFELFLLLMLVVGVEKLYFYYDSRYPFLVQTMFWGNILIPAAALVWSFVWLLRKIFSKSNVHFHTLLRGLILFCVPNTFIAASVPSLMHRYYLPLGIGTRNQYLLFVLVDLLFFLCGIIFLAGSFLLAWKEQSPTHKYHEENLFFFGQVISKLNTTSKTMTLVSITLVLPIFLFIAAPVLVNWAMGYLDSRSMYDIQIFSYYNNVYEESDLPHDDYEIVTKLLMDQGIETVYDCTFHLYLPEKKAFHNRMKYDFPAAAISLHDYNAIRCMLGLSEITLEENEFTTQWHAAATDDERRQFLETHQTVTTDAGLLRCAKQAYHQEPMGETLYNSYTNVLYVFPDATCDTLLPVMQNRYLMTAKTIPYENAHSFEQEFTAVYPEETATGVHYGIRLRTLQVNETKGTCFVLQAAMLYGAIVLMVICLTVLSLQQLLDAGHYRYRFSVLRSLGVEESKIEKLVFKQLGVWFGLPVIAAIVVAVVVISYFMQTISIEISTYIGFPALLSQLGITVGILVLLLICYFISTWILFRHSARLGTGNN